MSTDLIPLKDPNPSALFKAGGMDALLSRIEADARSLVPDLSTKKGREAIASNAARVARSKTYLDGLGKDFVSDLKASVLVVDRVRKDMRDRLDALKDEVRRPLTEWEDAEDARKDAHKKKIEWIRDMERGADALGSAAISERIAAVDAVEDGEAWEEFRAEAAQAKGAVLYRLMRLHAAAVEQEVAAARAEEERVAREEKERKEMEDRIAKEAAERATREAEERAAAERARAEHERQAALRAQQDAERRAAAAEELRKQEAARAIERERAAVERAKREAEERAAAERARAERAAAEERRKEEEAKRKAEAEEARRQANVAHRANVHREISARLVEFGLAEGMASMVVKEIAGGMVPRLSITY